MTTGLLQSLERHPLAVEQRTLHRKILPLHLPRTVARCLYSRYCRRRANLSMSLFAPGSLNLQNLATMINDVQIARFVFTEAADGVGRVQK